MGFAWCCMSHGLQCNLFTLRRHKPWSAASHHSSRSTPIHLLCYSIPSAADNTLSWSSSVPLLWGPKPFPALIAKEKRLLSCLWILVRRLTLVLNWTHFQFLNSTRFMSLQSCFYAVQTRVQLPEYIKIKKQYAVGAEHICYDPIFFCTFVFKMFCPLYLTSMWKCFT